MSWNEQFVFNRKLTVSKVRIQWSGYVHPLKEGVQIAANLSEKKVGNIYLHIVLPFELITLFLGIN